MLVDVAKLLAIQILQTYRTNLDQRGITDDVKPFPNYTGTQVWRSI